MTTPTLSTDFVDKLRLEYALLERLLYKNKSQHGRTCYFSRLLGVRRAQRQISDLLTNTSLSSRWFKHGLSDAGECALVTDAVALCERLRCSLRALAIAARPLCGLLQQTYFTPFATCALACCGRTFTMHQEMLKELMARCRDAKSSSVRNVLVSHPWILESSVDTLHLPDAPPTPTEEIEHPPERDTVAVVPPDDSIMNLFAVLSDSDSDIQDAMDVPMQSSPAEAVNPPVSETRIDESQTVSHASLVGAGHERETAIQAIDSSKAGRASSEKEARKPKKDSKTSKRARVAGVEAAEHTSPAVNNNVGMPRHLISEPSQQPLKQKKRKVSHVGKSGVSGVSVDTLPTKDSVKDMTPGMVSVAAGQFAGDDDAAERKQGLKEKKLKKKQKQKSKDKQKLKQKQKPKQRTSDAVGDIDDIFADIL